MSFSVCLNKLKWKWYTYVGLQGFLSVIATSRNLNKTIVIVLVLQDSNIRRRTVFVSPHGAR